MRQISIHYSDSSSQTLNIHQIPDKCPLCHHGIDPVNYSAFCDKNKWNKDNCLQIIYRCTRDNCRNLFIGCYKADNTSCNSFEFKYSTPVSKTTRTFTDTVKSISPSFCLIYNQALAAEEDNLKEICGVGYRKAIEFLMKDYLIAKNPEKADDIKRKFLGNCIEDDIENNNIKAMAKRAAWLGNDETHYLRKWEDKDLGDLKKLIDATLYWIEMEKLAEETVSDMPEGK